MTITELLVGVALLGVVLGAAYGVAHAVNVGQRQTDDSSARSRAVGYPLERMREIIMQNTRIETGPGPYQLSVRTDQNVDDIQELHVFTLVTTAGRGTHIQHRASRLNATGSPTPLFTHQLGTNLTNQAAGVPIFRYFNSAGNEITDMARVAGDARSMEITVRATSGTRTISETTNVQFRNRRQ